MASIEFEPSEYLDEVSTHDLISEIEKRETEYRMPNVELTRILYLLKSGDDEGLKGHLAELIYAEIGRIV